MTQQQYQQIRKFVLHSTWEKLYDSWGGPYADKTDLQRNILQTVQEMDKFLGNTEHRNNITLAVDIVQPEAETMIPDSPLTILQNLWNKIKTEKLHLIPPDEEPMKPEDTAHSWRHSISHFAFRTTKSGLELMGSVAHEGEHANQSDKSRYTADELKIIAIFRAVNCSPETNFTRYQNNYNEMAARIQEAKLYLDIFQYAQNDPEWDIQEREFFVQQFRDLNARLTDKVTKTNRDDVINFLVKGLKTTEESCELIDAAFPGADSHQSNIAASEFMDTTGRDMMHKMHDELWNYSAEISAIIRQLDREVNPDLDRARTIQQDARKQIIRTMQAAGVTFVEKSQMVPFPQECINLEHREENVPYALQMAEMYHNPALIVTTEGLCCVYDKEPIIRPYGRVNKENLPDDPELSYDTHDTPSYDTRFDEYEHDEP